MKKVAILLTLAIFVFAADTAGNNPLSPQNFRSQNDQEALQGGNDDLKVNHFYLGLGNEEIKDVQKKDQNLQEVFDEFDETIVNYKPVQKPISTVDKITTHPYFTTTILLPQGSVISSVDISVEPITLKFEQNTILLRVKKDFRIANMAVIYTLEKKNYVANFLIERYQRENTDEKLNLVLSYLNVAKKDDFEIINTYVKLYGKYPQDEYNYIDIDGITYRIIKDPKFGGLHIGKQTYRVDTGNRF